MELAVLIVSVLLVITGLMVWVILSLKSRFNHSANDNMWRQEAEKLSVSWNRLDAELLEKRVYIGQLQEKVELLSSQKQDVESLSSQYRDQLSTVKAQLEEVTKQNQEYKQLWLENTNEIKNIQCEYNQLKENYVVLNSSQAQQSKTLQEKIDHLEESKEVMKTEFKQLANDILEKKVVSFKEVNKESVENLLNPIHLELKKFKDRVEKIHSTDFEQRIQITAEMKNLQKTNQEVMEKSERLAAALHGQKKIQGNWGELILERILDGAGLRRDFDYKREVSFNTEEGKKRPDVVVYLPKNKHIVIDSKTSLVSYTQYVNTENEQNQQAAIKAHVRAVGDHINELSDREYHRLPGLNSPEVVVMFIPIESAYVEALKYDPTLFQKALDKNILVTTPTTLLTSLNIVRQLWQFEKQNEYAVELKNRAEKFYKKLNGFLRNLETVGDQLDRAKESYNVAMQQFYLGKGNLIKKASEFKELGVSVDKELPEHLVEKSKAEL